MTSKFDPLQPRQSHIRTEHKHVTQGVDFWGKGDKGDAYQCCSLQSHVAAHSLEHDARGIHFPSFADDTC